MIYGGEAQQRWTADLEGADIPVFKTTRAGRARSRFLSRRRSHSSPLASVRWRDISEAFSFLCEHGMSTEAETAPETHPFQAEVAELLRLMVHSVYSETDIFLRELISNASDACDKLRYEAIAQARSCWQTAARWRIRITPDTEAGTLTISDTGIGMDRQELIDNLGTVARSGTRAFIEPAGGGQGRRRADRPVRRRLLFRLHGGRPHRGDQPPGGCERGVGLALLGRSRLRDCACRARSRPSACRAAPRSSST